MQVGAEQRGAERGAVVLGAVVRERVRAALGDGARSASPSLERPYPLVAPTLLPVPGGRG